MTPPNAARAAHYEKLKREERTVHVPKLQVRADAAAGDGADWTLDGYACVTETPYTMSDMWGPFIEVVAAGAFAKTLQESADVRLLLNHDDLPLARTKSGTMTLDEDETGLHVLARLLAADPDVQRVVPKMQRGDLDEMSFMFQVIRWEWNDDYTVRRILEVRLFDVSLVTFPANPAAQAALRGVRLLEQLANSDPDLVMAEVRSAGLGRETLTSVHELIGRMLGEQRSNSAPPATSDTPDTMYLTSLQLRQREQEQLDLQGRP